MRISTAQLQQQGTTAILQRFNELSKTQLELATGKRINRTSDDPLGATQILPLKDTVEIHNQYEKNADVAESRLFLEDGILASASDMLVQINELAIQGNNDSLGATERAAIAQEVRQFQASLVSLANSKDGNGDYLFAGDNVDTVPIQENPAGTFTYTGDDGQRNVQIGVSRQIAVGDPGSDIFMNIAFSGGGNQSVFATVESLINDLEANNPSATTLTDLTSAMDSLSSTRAKVGARLNAIDNQRGLNEELILRSKETISEIEDLDIAEAVGRLNIQLAGLQASQQVFTRLQNLSLFNFL